MPAVVATVTQVSSALLYSGGTGVNANDVVVQTNDISRFDSFSLTTTAGSVNVYVSLDGTTYASVPLAMNDLGTVGAPPATVANTVAGHVYTFYGNFRSIKVEQNGATAATGVELLCTKKGGQR